MCNKTVTGQRIKLVIRPWNINHPFFEEWNLQYQAFTIQCQ